MVSLEDFKKAIKVNKRWLLSVIETLGFVKNLPDGTVYIEAEGPEPKLNELLKFAKQGPKHAQVEKVEYEFTKPKYDYKGFEYDF